MKASGQESAKPAHFDTALVVEDACLFKSEGGIAGNFGYIIVLSQVQISSFYRSSCCAGSINFQAYTSVWIFLPSSRLH